jgi:integrase
MPIPPRGRPNRYAPYDRLVESLPPVMKKRPKYVNGIGVFRGKRGETAWIKIRVRRQSTYNGRSYQPGSSLEIKIGALSSWSWEQLEQQHREMQGKADRGEPLEEAQQFSFSEFAADWLSRAEPRVEDYGSLEIHVRCHLKPTFGSKFLSSITRADINTWQSDKLRTHKPATVKRQLSTFKAIINDALNSGLIENSPLTNLATINGIQPRQRYLSGEEVVILLVKAEEVQDWLSDFILWQLHSGMRKGETQALLWSDIHDLGDGRLIAQILTSKSGTSRSVPCTETMKAVLEKQKGRKVANDDRIFPVSDMTLRRRWEAARKQAGLEDVTVHDLRRTHSTRAVVAGVDLRTLMRRMGHSNLNMIERVYAAYDGTAAEDAARKIEEAFTPRV